MGEPLVSLARTTWVSAVVPWGCGVGGMRVRCMRVCGRGVRGVKRTARKVVGDMWGVCGGSPIVVKWSLRGADPRSTGPLVLGRGGARSSLCACPQRSMEAISVVGERADQERRRERSIVQRPAHAGAAHAGPPHGDRLTQRPAHAGATAGAAHTGRVSYGGAAVRLVCILYNWGHAQAPYHPRKENEKP